MSSTVCTPRVPVLAAPSVKETQRIAEADSRKGGKPRLNTETRRAVCGYGGIPSPGARPGLNSRFDEPAARAYIPGDDLAGGGS